MWTFATCDGVGRADSNDYAWALPTRSVVLTGVGSLTVCGALLLMEEQEYDHSSNIIVLPSCYDVPSAKARQVLLERDDGCWAEGGTVESGVP